MRKELNRVGKMKIPTLFIISFDKKKFYIKPLKEVDNDVMFEIENSFVQSSKKIDYSYKPVSYQRYKSSFNKVIEHIKSGNTYMLNLTFPSEINTNLSLKDIYKASFAKYKIYFKDKFVSFSPETFIEIKENKIYTFPMKGTIDTNIKNAKEKILSDSKEMAEHTMVVDLLRNDLGIIGKNVKVNKFRFIDKIKAGEKELLQVSSEIEAYVPNWQKKWLEMILKLLPAGSISGTPKKKTIEIIKRVEGYERGFYTGIFGITDEKTFLDSAVIIRYIEKPKSFSIFNFPFYIYKSGGGITIDSNVKEEYNELINKVYIPHL
jgi:para-aminobenzoate synthetase component 1